MKLATMIVVLGIFVVLPVIIVALVTRAKTHAINKRAYSGRYPFTDSGDIRSLCW